MNPFLRGWYLADEAQRRNALGGLQQVQGILGIQQAMRQQQMEEQTAPLKMELLRSQVQQAQNPSPIFKDLGGEIGVFHPRTMQQIGALPKTATPDAIVRERGSAERHATPSGSSLLSNQTQRELHAIPSGSAQLGANVTMRGQNMTDSRSRDANSIALEGKTADRVTSLRKEFNDVDAVKNFRTVVPIVQSAQNAPDTPAGDLDLIYAVGKVLDPTSVVREGEMNLVIKSGSPLQRFQGAVNYITQGRGRLTPDQRTELNRMLMGRAGELKQGYDAARELYGRSAAAQGLPADQIFIESPAFGRRASDQQKSVKRTGTYNGRKVVEYSDGTVEYQ